jgi:steroid delta-isomerase-like uncharacterized protein
LSESENERVVREFYKYVEKKDFDGIRELLQDDFKWVCASTKEWGFDRLRKAGTEDTRAFPDVKINFQRIVAHGNSVIVEYDWVGTHKEEYFGIPATNREVKVPFVEIFELENGKIILVKTYANMILLHQQITGKPYLFHSI